MPKIVTIRKMLAELIALRNSIAEEAAPIQARIDRLCRERDRVISEAQAEEYQLAADIRIAVIAEKKSTTYKEIIAVFGKKTSWDTKGLNGYAKAHPSVIKFRKETPYCQIRKSTGRNFREQL